MALDFQQFKELRAKGLSPEQIVKFEGGFKPPVSAQPAQEPGFVQGAVQSIASPFLRAGVTGFKAAKGLGAIATGNIGALRSAADTEPIDFGYLGKVKPVTGIKEAVGIGTQIAGTLTGKPAIGGALIGGGTALEEDKGIKETAIRTGVGALTAKAGQIGITKGLKALQKPAEKIFESALKVGGKVIEKGRSPAKKLLEEGIVGTKKAVTKQLTTLANKSGKVVRTALEKRKDKLSVNRALDSTIKHYAQKGVVLTRDEIRKQVSKAVPKAKDLIQSGKLIVKEANQLRSNIDSTLGDKAFLQSTTIPPFSKELATKFTNTLRSTVKKIAPETKEPFSKQAAALTGLKGLAKKENILTKLLTDAALLGGIPGVSSLFGKTKEGTAVGVLLTGLRRGVLPKTATAQFLNWMSKQPEKPTAKAVINFLSKIAGGEVGKLEK